MKCRARTSAIILLILMLCCSALAESVADDPIVVRVGKFSYPRSKVQASLDGALDFSEALLGDMPTEEEKASRLQIAIDSFIGLGLIENKLTEAGKNDFSEAEMEDMSQAANGKYDEFWQLVYDRMQKEDESVQEKDVTETMDSLGYTFQAFLDEYILQARQNRIIEMYCGDVTLSQEMVDDYYEEQFVGPDREDYKDDLEKYESEIIANNNESFYTPEGYRYIRQIVLQYPEEALSACTREEMQVKRAARSLSKALQKLTLAATQFDGSTEALTEAKADYDRATDQLTDARTAYLDALRAATEPLVRDTLNEIRERFDAGIGFTSLIDKYSTDRTEKNLNGDGYPFHPDSPNWPEPFAVAARALEKPGDISEAVYTDEGVHILYYAGDAPAGEHVLTEDEKSLLNAAALRYYQMEKLNVLLEGWREEYEIETHPELLKY